MAVSKKQAPQTSSAPLVGVIMGSESDWPRVKEACMALEKFGVPFIKKVVSAHRTPELVADFANVAEKLNLKVIIAAAGGAAHLPGMIAAHLSIPVVGIPLANPPLQGIDALYSVVQMPSGVPVATVSVDNAWNGGVLAAQIVATSDSKLAEKVRGRLADYKQELRDKVLKSKI